MPSGACDPGFYCPTGIMNGQLNKTIGSYGPQQVPCPGGTYQLNHTSATISDCIICPAGHSCVDGSSSPTECSLGHFCPNGTTYPTPCPVGTIGPNAVMESQDDCIPCPGGRYCDSPGLVTPRGPCDPGYVCYEGAKNSAPTDGTTGEVCPAGGYCPTGSSQSQPCPPGTFSNTSGASNTFDCQQCTPGFYCVNSRSASPTGPCHAGYFCPGGARTPMQNVTQPGHFSDEGSAAQTPCNVGTWMNSENASQCDNCTAGYYCPGHGNTELTLCPAGFYCEEGSGDPLPCLNGTYSNRTGLESSDECTPCPPGMYCATGGLQAPEGPCRAGHVCYNTSSLPAPVFSDEVTFGDICQPGRYCPEGSGFHRPCPAGTYSSARGLEDVTECTPCRGGYACTTDGLIEPDTVCTAGHYCVSGAVSPAPYNSSTGDICPVSTYCPQQSTSPIPCQPGHYANSTGNSQCLQCSEGFYCHVDISVSPVICPLGHYCPQGSGLNYMACPRGTIGTRTGLTAESECEPCPAGEYCELSGQSTSNGSCSAGFYCTSGAASPTPELSDTTGPCSTGHYCPEHSVLPTSCPRGTYSSSELNQAITDCLPCSPGAYCDSSGLSSPSGLCAAGWYCTNGSSEAKPTNASDGGICPEGHACVAGSSQPLPCIAGTYTNSTGNSVCLQCPEGFFCDGATVDPYDFPCPAGYYCPQGTTYNTQFPCPIGTINPLSRSRSEAACTFCPVGSYCNISGLSAVSGLCLAGSFCAAGSTSEAGRACASGYYCPYGTQLEVDCPPGMYCSGTRNFEPTGNCSAGYYCISTAASPMPLMVLLEENVQQEVTVHQEAHQEFLASQGVMVMLKEQGMRLKVVFYALGATIVKELDWCLHQECVMLDIIVPQAR